MTALTLPFYICAALLYQLTVGVAGYGGPNQRPLPPAAIVRDEIGPILSRHTVIYCREPGTRKPDTHWSWNRRTNRPRSGHSDGNTMRTALANPRGFEHQPESLLRLVFAATDVTVNRVFQMDEIMAKFVANLKMTSPNMEPAVFGDPVLGANLFDEVTVAFGWRVGYQNDPCALSRRASLASTQQS